MNVIEFMKKVVGETFQTEGTVDKLVFGDGEREVKKVATCLTASVDVIKKALEYGADLIITHEPTFYKHTDVYDAPNPLEDRKRKLAKDAGIPICRFHDYMHFCDCDMIGVGFLKALGWEQIGKFDGKFKFTLEKEKNPLEIAAEIESKLDIKHVRIVGAKGGKVKNIGLFLGHRGSDCWRALSDTDEYDLGVGGEWCEWADGERIRDCAQFGLQKTALMLGHAASERNAMKYLADDINDGFGIEGIEARYIECGELFGYTDN